jgi:hypothetical protein
MMKQKDERNLVIPGLTRNLTEGNAEPAVHHWIPAYAGMTGVFIRFSVTAY